MMYVNYNKFNNAQKTYSQGMFSFVCPILNNTSDFDGESELISRHFYVE